MTEEQNWTQYWQKDGASGEVFVDKDGNKHSALGEFWRQRIPLFAEQGAIIDLACGAGSVFADLAETNRYELHAADISETALNQLKQRMPSVNTRVCSADALPYENDSFDLVVSQFGIEYAGDAGFFEAGRIVKIGGHLCVLCHIQDGYIDSKNFSELQGAELVKELQFIECAKEVVIAFDSQNENSMKSSMDRFVAVEPQLANAITQVNSGVHLHLYQGFKQLFSRRQAYTLSDTLNWLDEMDKEVDKAILRLTEMRKAAFSRQRMEAIIKQLELNGLRTTQFAPFTLPGHDLPVAWHFEAVKD